MVNCSIRANILENVNKRQQQRGAPSQKTQKQKKLTEIYQKVNMLQGRLLIFLKAGAHHRFHIEGGIHMKAKSPLVTFLNSEAAQRTAKNKMQVLVSGKSQLGSSSILPA